MKAFVKWWGGLDTFDRLFFPIMAVLIILGIALMVLVAVFSYALVAGACSS